MGLVIFISLDYLIGFIEATFEFDLVLEDDTFNKN